MLQLAVSSGYFRRCTAGKPSKRKRELVMLRSTAKAPTLLTVYATCIYLALKVCDRVPHVSMLSAMLSYVLHDRVDPAQVGAWSLVGARWGLSQASGADALVWEGGAKASLRRTGTCTVFQSLIPMLATQAVQLEWQCLVGLQWRLGPYFAAPRPAPRETGPQNAEAPPAPDS